MRKLTYIITGMRCQACSSSVNAKVSKLKGVNSFELNLLSGFLEMEVNELFNEQELFAEINSLGFEIVQKTSSSSLFLTDRYYKWYELLILLICTICVLFVTLTNVLSDKPLIFNALNMYLNPINYVIFMMAFSLPIFIIGFRFYIPGFKRLFKLHPTMESLISLASIVAFIYSFVYSIFVFVSKEPKQYLMNIIYESGCVAICLTYLGKFLEQKIKNKNKNSFNDLINIIPQNCEKLCNSSTFSTVCVNEIQVDDILRIKKGQRIPVDGTIIFGNCEVDNSAVNGESSIKNLSIGSNVLAGSIVVNGEIQIKAIKVSSEATLNNILALVSKSNYSKSRMSNIIDKISLYFVPTILFLALLTFIIWISISKNATLSLNFFITMLVVSCPCSIGLAIPLTYVMTSIKALKNSFVFKNMDILSKFKNLKYIVFDKTGTLTSGDFDVNIETIYDETKSETFVYSVLASLEKDNEHPIGKSILKATLNKDISKYDCTNVKDIDGIGLTGIIDNKTYYLGNKKIFKYLNLDSFYIENGTTLYLLEDKQLIAKILLKDQINEGTAELLNYLSNKKYTIMMLTGDNEASAKDVANRLNIKFYKSSLLPKEKYEIIEKIKQKNNVLYIGDGINDAPCLSLADVSIAPYKSSDIANNSSDIYLLSNSMKNVIKVIKLSHYSNLILRLNVIWTFLYNIIVLFIASGVFYNLNVVLKPWMGALAMGISSVCVLLSSITIRIKKI